MSLKNPVTPPGIDPGTVRLVAQRLKHYATPGTNVQVVFSVIHHTTRKVAGDIMAFWGKTAIPKSFTRRNKIYMKAVVYGRRRLLNYIPFLDIMPSRSAWLTDAANIRRSLSNGPCLSVCV